HLVHRDDALVEAEPKGDGHHARLVAPEVDVGALRRLQAERGRPERDPCAGARRTDEEPPRDRREADPEERGEPARHHHAVRTSPTRVKYPAPARAVCWRSWSWRRALRSGAAASYQRETSSVCSSNRAQGPVPGALFTSGASRRTSSRAGVRGVRVARS